MKKLVLTNTKRCDLEYNLLPADASPSGTYGSVALMRVARSTSCVTMQMHSWCERRQVRSKFRCKC